MQCNCSQECSQASFAAGVADGSIVKISEITRERAVQLLNDSGLAVEGDAPKVLLS